MMTFIWIFIAISVLILVHEWGHFYSARRLGIKVEEFGFGFPPRMFSRVKNGVRYSFNWLPFGGFVKIFGEHGEGEGSHESFVSRSARQRFVVLSAGVFMNFVLAWVFFSAGAVIGVPEIVDSVEGDGLPVSILTVVPGSPAEAAGLRFGDTIQELRAGDGSSVVVSSEDDVQSFVDEKSGEEITLVVGRGEELREVAATPRANPPEGEGALGIALGRITVEPVPLYAAPFVGFQKLLVVTSAIFHGLGIFIADLITEGSVPADVAGPVGIFFFAHDISALGLAFVLQFIGILSVNLAVLNLLPIPALDGGRIFFLLIEKLKGSRVNPAYENSAHTIGFVLLIILIILITYRDIARII